MKWFTADKEPGLLKNGNAMNIPILKCGSTIDTDQRYNFTRCSYEEVR